MGLLILLPHWPLPEQGWLLRMLDGLRRETEAVGVYEVRPAQAAPLPVRAFPLQRPRSRADRWRSRFGLRTHNTTNYILRSELARPGVSAVLCHYGFLAVMFEHIWGSTQVPLYVHFHGCDAMVDIRRDEDAGRRYHADDYLARLRRLAPRAVFIANSAFTRQVLLDEGIAPRELAVHRMGVALPARAREHRPGGPVRIVSVGRLIDCKSPDRTMAAFERLCARGVDATLTLLGDGQLRPMCELLRVRSPYRDRIRIAGALPHAATLAELEDSDIYTQHNVEGEVTRQVESYGVSVLEAMAAGLPVVGTRSGGIQETVVDGETGYLGAPGDVDAQAARLYELAVQPDLRARLGAAGRARVQRHFSLEADLASLRRILGLG